jgi:mRNA interferase RelE/StbE
LKRLAVSWVLKLSRRAVKDLRSIPKDDLHRIDAALSAMLENPLSGDTKMLRGAKGALRRRVGAWRIIFELDDETVIVLRVLRRTTTTYRG